MKSGLLPQHLQIELTLCMSSRIFFAFCDYLDTSFRSHSLSLKCFEVSLYSILLHCFLVCLIPPKKRGDRKSTRLNSSHQIISYAVFCLKKKIRHTYSAYI